MQFESWIDRQIREAMERGEFDNLPGAGKPLELDDSDDWWIKAKIKRENLEPVLPGVLSLRKEAETIQEKLADVKRADRAREIVEDLNRRIREFYARGWAPGEPRVVVKLVDVDAALQAWCNRRENSGRAD
ncbi:DnaJ family domain-containing protein [Nigerium sp.]|uniref:DnaJ family domain-containing protein n=1 Tax=Nigerium sp. TaxID=2042655 RepID=UPI0032216FCB